MNRTASRRLLAQSPLGLFPELAPACRTPARCLRPFSQSPRRKADENDNAPPPASQLERTPPSPTASFTSPEDDFVRPSPSVNPKARSPKGSAMGGLTSFMSVAIKDRGKSLRSPLLNTMIASDGSSPFIGAPPVREHIEPHHIHILASRHNTHITLTGPDRSPIISVSCGHIGFRKANRKHYDSAFQLASYVMTRMQDTGINAQIKALEVTLRGFGAGREAVTKAMLGLEGKNVRHKIVKVADATRLKFGGTRSKKPRRLG